MIDLREIQDKLNSDKCYAEGFVKDPVGILEKEGVILDDVMKRQLLESLSAKDSPSGSSVRKDGGIMISISKDF